MSCENDHYRTRASPFPAELRRRAFLCLRRWDLKNPFAKIEPPLHKEAQIRYLLLSDIRRLLAYLKARQKGYGSALAYHLANALFQTACRFDEIDPAHLGRLPGSRKGNCGAAD